MSDKVRDVMQPDPVTVHARTTIQEAAKLMREHDVGILLMTKGDQVRGLLTDRDIVVRSIAAEHHPAATFVSECCSSEEVETVEAEAPVDVAAKLMRHRGVHRLPVMDDGQLVGIVSVGDLALAQEPTATLAGISAAPPNH
jgi:CBS domain-containing protein